MGMSLTAFASDPVTTNSFTITVQGLQANTVVKYKQIVKATDAGAWELGDGLGTGEGKVNIGMTAAEIQNKYTANESYASSGTINPNLTDLNLSGITEDMLTSGGTASGGQDLVINVSAPGLYAIKAETTNNYVYSWMLAYVGFGADGQKVNATVKAKGQTNQVTKAVGADRVSAGSGDTIPYTVTVKYPYFADDVTNRIFTITDKVTGGKFVGSPTIKVLNEDNSEATGENGLAKDDETSTDTMLVISLTSYKPAMAGKTIQVTYNVKVDNEIEKLTNEVSTEIKHKTGEGDPDPDPTPENKTEYKIELPSFNAKITKTDENENKLTGSEVEFKLYREKNSTDPTDIKTEKVKVLNKEGEQDLVFVATKSSTNGEVEFKGLAAEKDVKYYVKETKAPSGFALQENAYPLTGATVATNPSEQTTTTQEGNLTVTVVTKTYIKDNEYDQVGFGKGLKFIDTQLSSLPSTGGIGTTIFTIGGCAIMIIAAALFFASRRKSAK